MSDKEIFDIIEAIEVRIGEITTQMAIIVGGEKPDEYKLGDLGDKLIHCMDMRRGLEMREHQFAVRTRIDELQVRSMELDIEAKEHNVAFQSQRRALGSVGFAMEFGKGFARELVIQVGNKWKKSRLAS